TSPPRCAGPAEPVVAGGSRARQYSPMAARAPRHLAEPPRRFGLSPLQRVFLAALVGLAALTAVIALLTRDAGNGGRRAGRPPPPPPPAPATPPGRPSRSGPPRGACSPAATSSATWPAGPGSAGPSWPGSRAGRRVAGRP